MDDQGRYSLNALHAASGKKKKNGPSYWLALDSTKSLISELKSQTTDIPVVTLEGRNGGTFAHELLAVSYAGWISPVFQLKVNQTFIDYRTGKSESKKPPLPDFTNPAEAARAWADQYDSLQREGQISTALARRIILDKEATEVGNMLKERGNDGFGYREFVRIIEGRLGEPINENHFRDWLLYKKYLVRDFGFRGAEYVPTAKAKGLIFRAPGWNSKGDKRVMRNFFTYDGLRKIGHAYLKYAGCKNLPSVGKFDVSGSEPTKAMTVEPDDKAIEQVKDEEWLRYVIGE